jgi:hypothetical protein
MYRTYYDPAYDCLFVQHFGAFEGAEIQKAVLGAFEQMPLNERSACELILLDLRDVTSATMNDTDRAKLNYSQRAFAEILGVNTPDARHRFQSVRVARVMDPDNPCTPILMKRLNAHRNVFKNHITVNELAEAFTFLGLPTDYEVQHPDVPKVSGIKPTEIE